MLRLFACVGFLYLAHLSSASQCAAWAQPVEVAPKAKTIKAEEETVLEYFDITIPLAPGVPQWDSEEGVTSNLTTLITDMALGHPSFSSWLSLSAHTATHIDSPAHFLPEERAAGNGVDKVPLHHLIGRALVVEVPPGTNITAEALQALAIPPDCERLLFKTDSTTRGLMHTPKFHSDFTALTPDGAEWLVGNTHVNLVGIDYLSIAVYDQNKEGHLPLLQRQPVAVTIVEGLDLSPLHPGRWYHLTCLPLRVTGLDGAPARCLAAGPDKAYEQWREEVVAAGGSLGPAVSRTNTNTNSDSDGEAQALGRDHTVLKAGDEAVAEA